MTRPDHINLSNLVPGTEVKNYSELCTLLGIKPNTNIQRQLKEISKYIDVEKVEGSRRYIIKGIKEEKDYKLEVRSDSKYLKQMQDILLYELLNADGNQIVCMHRQLTKIFAGVNDVFYEEKTLISHVLGICKDAGIRDLHITTKQVSGFKDIVESNLGFRIRRGLESMESRKLITVSDGYLIQDNEYENHLADKKENMIIRSIEAYLFDKYKYNSWGEVFLYKKDMDSFLSDWHKETTDLGINVYKAKVIKLNPDVIDDIRSIELDINKLRKELNNIFIDIVYKKRKEQYDTDKDAQYYFEIGEVLSEALMQLDSDLSKELKSMIVGITKNRK